MPETEELTPAHQWGDLGGGLATAGPLLDTAVGVAAADGASYADVRLSETQELRLYAVSGRAPDERLEGNLGLGVRVLLDGVWGFASLPLREAADAGLAARLAVANARAAAVGSRERVMLPPRPAECGQYQTQAAHRSVRRARRRPRARRRRRPGRRDGDHGGAAGPGRHQRQAHPPVLRQHRGLAAGAAFRRVRRHGARGGRRPPDSPAAQLPQLLSRQHRGSRLGVR